MYFNDFPTINYDCTGDGITEKIQDIIMQEDISLQETQYSIIKENDLVEYRMS